MDISLEVVEVLKQFQSNDNKNVKQKPVKEIVIPPEKNELLNIKY